MGSLDALEAISNVLASVLPLTAAGGDGESTGRARHADDDDADAILRPQQIGQPIVKSQKSILDSHCPFPLPNPDVTLSGTPI